MKSKAFLASIVATVSFILVACSPSPGLEFTQDETVEVTCDVFQEWPDHSGDVLLGVNGTLTVILCSNSTTGFQWLELPQISDPSALRQVDHKLVPPEAEGSMGAAGKEIWTFEILKKGESTIYFKYSQPWEGAEKAKWTYELTVFAR